MQLWWIIQICLSCFMLSLSILKVVQFEPYLFPMNQGDNLKILILLALNLAATGGGLFKKGLDHDKQTYPFHALFGMNVIDFVLCLMIVAVNAYGLTIEDYRWIGCVTSIVCRNLSAYSWYTIAELVTASISALFSFSCMVYLQCNKSKYTNDLSKEVETV